VGIVSRPLVMDIANDGEMDRAGGSGGHGDFRDAI
jgi:hypothetical protein